MTDFTASENELRFAKERMRIAIRTIAEEPGNHLDTQNAVVENAIISIARYVATLMLEASTSQTNQSREGQQSPDPAPRAAG